MFTSSTNSSKSKTMIKLDSTNSPTAIRSNCRSKFTSKLALTLFYSDKPISPYKQEHTRCPSQPKTIKTSKTLPLLRVSRSKTNDISGNFTKLDLYRSKKRRENTKRKEKQGTQPQHTSSNSSNIFVFRHHRHHGIIRLD